MVTVENLLTFLGMASLLAGLVYPIWKAWVVKGDPRRARNAAMALTIVLMSLVCFIAWNQHKKDQTQIDSMKDELKKYDANEKHLQEEILALNGQLLTVKTLFELSERQFEDYKDRTRAEKRKLYGVLQTLKEGIGVSRRTLNEAQQKLSTLRQNYRHELLESERWEYMKALLNRLRNRSPLDFFDAQTQGICIDEMEAQIFELRQASKRMFAELDTLDGQLIRLEQQVNGLSSSFIISFNVRIGPETKWLIE